MPDLGSHTFRRLVTACALVASITAAGAWGLSAERTEAGSGSAAAMSIDTDISGNTPSNPPTPHAETLGSNDTSRSASPCDLFEVDVTVTNIPPSNPIVGFGLAINYAPAAFTVTTSDSNFLLKAAAGSAVFSADEGTPSDDGVFNSAAADVSANSTESGSGVLDRVTLEVKPGVPAGAYALVLSEAAHIDLQNITQLPDILNGATINIDGSCNGDVDCSLAINSVDALKVLRHNAGLSVTQTEPCANIGADIGARDQGDVDCNGTVNSVDALKVLRAVTALTIIQEPGCPPVVP